MLNYLLKRLLLIIPTLWGIITINFIIIQFLPGGPVEQTIAKLTMPSISATDRLENQNETTDINFEQSEQSMSQGVSIETLNRIKKMYGFDKPVWQRYLDLIQSYITFDLGKSYYRDIGVVDIIKEKLPVSISLGFWSTLLLYGISIPLGIKKAVRQGSKFDKVTTNMILLGNATPTFLFAMLMIIFFASGEYLDIFPLRGLTSDDFETLSWHAKILDYLWHLILPIMSISISGFATLTLLTKNSFLDEIHKTYVLTAKLKGLNDHKVLYNHILRNALLLIISSIP